MKLSGREWATEPCIDQRTNRTLDLVAAFYDTCKVGYQGHEGYRKSTDLRKFSRCIGQLVRAGHIHPEHTVFTDLGCADGRVNVMMSYFVRTSIGIEIDPDILSEYEPHKKALLEAIEEEGLDPPRDNIHLFQGSSLDPSVYRRIREETGLRFRDMDLFYTYITLHDEFAERISRDAAEGALYLVYGFHRVLPSYPGFEIVIPDVGDQQIAALFRKGRTGKRLDCRTRSGTFGDWDFIAALSREAFAEYGDYEVLLPSCLGDPRFHTLIGESEGGPVGFCMLSIGEDAGEVVAVAVEELWQGRGVGRRLMQEMEREARNRGIRVLLLKTAIGNLPAQGLFRKIGFEESGRRAGYYAGGQTAIGMCKRI